MSKNISNLVKGGNFVYHVTDQRNLNSILSKGIDNSYQSQQWRTLNEFLESVADVEGIQNKPSHRAQCTFCFSRFADIVDETENVVIVINLEKLNSPMFAGSYHKATEIRNILQEKSLNLVEDIIGLRNIDSEIRDAYNMALKYWSSLKRVKPPIHRGGEILIESKIGPDAIYQHTGRNT